MLGVVFLPQVSFVAGSLAVVRARRVRALGVLPTAELSIQRRRTLVGVVSGTLTFVSLAVVALDVRRDVDGWWTTGALVVSVAAVAVLGTIAVRTFRAALPVSPEGAAVGTVHDDLTAVARVVPGLQNHLPATPGRLLLLTSTVTGLAVALAGLVAGDPLDGLVRGVAEGLAVVGCWALLGGPLGLRD